MKTGMMVALWIFLLFGSVGCLGRDSEEATVHPSEPNPTQKSFLSTKKPGTSPSLPDNNLETLPSIIVDDPLLDLSIKEFKKKYAELPDDYEIKIGVNLSDFGNAFNIPEISSKIITKKEAERIKSVSADYEFFFEMSLKGLRFFPNVKELYIEGDGEDITLNRIRDISEIGYLSNLKVVSFGNCELGIGDSTEELKILTVMKNIDIEICCGIKDMNFLNYFSNLNGSSTRINLSNNFIKDIHPLSNLKEVFSLNLMQNQIEDISPLKNLRKVEQLSLTYNQIENIRPLLNLTKARFLLLSGNQIKDISALSNLTEISVLGLADNKIKDLTPLANLKKVGILNLENNEIQDISILLKITKLEELNVKGNPNIDPAQIMEFKKRAARGELVFEY